MGILDKLRTFTTTTPASAIAETIPEIEREHAAKTAELAALDQTREEAIFAEGEAAVDRIAKQRQAILYAIETLDIARAGAERRQREAEAREVRAAAEAAKIRMVALVDEWIERQKALHPALKAIVAEIARQREIPRLIQEHNAAVIGAGFADLEVNLPSNAWNEQLREAAAAEFGLAVPVNLVPGTRVDQPFPQDVGFMIPGYSHRTGKHWLEELFPELAGPPPDGRGLGGVVASIAAAVKRRAA